MELYALLFGFLLFFGIILFCFVNATNSQFKVKVESNDRAFKPKKTDLVEIYKDIYLKYYGCFSSLEEKFFAKKIVGNRYDSGIFIKNDEDTKQLIEQVINSGYDIYGYSLLHKYNNDYKNITIIELGVLGKLSGYNYLSVFSYDEKTRGNVYLTYSPPMDKEVPFDVTSEEYKSNKSKVQALSGKKGKNSVCGYPCLDSDGTRLVYDKKNFTCGSVGYPNIKTPTQFSVYQIEER